MKAIFNDQRKILSIGQNVWNEENRSDWCVITGGDEIDRDHLWAGGEALYSIGEQGIVAKDARAELKIKMARIRMQRNGMLSTCDWTQLSDSLLSKQVMGSWATYRQSLRDVPNQENFDPDDFEWPESP